MSSTHTGATAGPSRHSERRARQPPTLYRVVRPPRVNPPAQPRRILGEIEWWRVVPGQEPEPSLEQEPSLDAHVQRHPSPSAAVSLSVLDISPITSAAYDGSRPSLSPPQSPVDAQFFDFTTSH